MSLHPWTQLHEHDFGDISNHLHAYIFYYSLVQDIPRVQVILGTALLFSPSSLEFVHLIRSRD